MRFPDRIQGVFFDPGPTMVDIAQRPKPIAAILILILMLTAVFSYISAPYASKDSLQAMKDNVKIQERLGKERYEAMIASMENPNPTSILIRSAVFGPAMVGLILAFQALLLLILGRMFSSEGAYLPVLSVLLYAGLIDKLLGGLVRSVLVLLRKSVFQTSTGLALLLPSADFSSTPYILLSQIDFFQIWMFAVLGYGLSAVFKIPLKKGMILSYTLWGLKAAVNIALAFVGKSFMG
jgi:hypothetical protein